MRSLYRVSSRNRDRPSQQFTPDSNSTGCEAHNRPPRFPLSILSILFILSPGFRFRRIQFGQRRQENDRVNRMDRMWNAKTSANHKPVAGPLFTDRCKPFRCSKQSGISRIADSNRESGAVLTRRPRVRMRSRLVTPETLLGGRIELPIGFQMTSH